MELYILNRKFQSIRIVDNFTSFIWNEKYYEYGDFELVMPMTSVYLADMAVDNYLYCTDASKGYLMIIEEITIKTDLDRGDEAQIVGRSLESILDRRIVWGQKLLTGKLQNGFKTLIEEAFLNPKDPKRKIDNFVFVESDDERVTKLEFSEQNEYYGQSIYEIIKDQCKEKDMGFRVRLTEDFKFEFKLYFGEDRSYDQTKLPYIIFSPKFENIDDINYHESVAALKNSILVGGDGQGADKITAEAGNTSGLDRREMYQDANLSKTIQDSKGNSTEIPLAQYQKMLQNRGTEILQSHTRLEEYDGECETSTMWQFNKDYYIGDIVQTSDNYGHDGRARIIECIINYDSTSISKYPKFKILKDEEESET